MGTAMDGHASILASLYTRINQSSAERPGSVMGNAHVAGRNSGFMPNRLGVFPGVPAVEIQVGLLTGQSLPIFIQVVWRFRNSAWILVRRLVSRSRQERTRPFGSDRRNISITCCVSSKEPMRPSRSLRTGVDETLG